MRVEQADYQYDVLPGGSCGPDGQAELILISFELTPSLTGEAGRVHHSSSEDLKTSMHPKVSSRGHFVP